VPLTGDGSTGDVVVEVQGVKSNARQLSEWDVKLDYQWLDLLVKGKGQLTGSGTLRFRADLAGVRTKPAEAPTFLPRGGSATKDSVLTLTASGSSGDASCTRTLSGAADYVSTPALAGQPNHPTLGSNFALDAHAAKGQLALAFGFQTSPHTLTLSGTGTGCSGTFPWPATLGLLEGPMSLPRDQTDAPALIGPLPGLNLTLDANAGLLARPWPAPDIPSLTLTVNAAAAKNPPRDTVDTGL
jgi:hypothetical protein